MIIAVRQSTPGTHRHIVVLLALCAVNAFVAGCSGLSDVGNQDEESEPPFAEIVVLNQPFTVAPDKVRTRVRAGTEVFLSGKDSDSLVFPVVAFQWKLLTTGGVADNIRLVPRTRDTVSFSAPMVVQEESLDFELTVTDAKGRTATRNVEVLVEGVPDSQHFLSYNLDSRRTFRLNAKTSQNVAAGALPADVGFEILVRQLVSYASRSGGGPFLEVRRQVLQGQWLASYGASASCDDVHNPGFDVPLPAVNVDDIMALIDTSDPTLRPNPAWVDSYEVKLEISIAPTSGSLPSGVIAQVCAPDVPVPVPTSAAASWQATAKKAIRARGVTSGGDGMLELTLPQLLSLDVEPQSNPETAAAYYAKIDPWNERTTLLDWSKVNGFLSSEKTGVKWSDLAAGSDARAVYTNNFDLGFGRDMYAKLGSCDNGYAPPQLGSALEIAAVGHCDVAAVVINYSSLEAAAKKLNPQLVVAMEYSASPGIGEQRFVKFYVFALNVFTGGYDRVSSANLDGRGERYVPQVCTVCHGGTPGGVDAGGTKGTDGDAGATFLPWDPDAFLYSASNRDSEVDHSFTEKALVQQYTRASQAPGIRKLNQLAYLTFADPDQPQRYTLARQLVEGWYGTDGTNAFTASDYAAFVPSGWTKNGIDGIANTSDDNPEDAAALYQDVFARHCRACHIAHAPAAGASGAHLETFTNASGTFNTCDSELATDGSGVVLEPSSIGVAHQVPMACYRQFLNAPSLANRISTGLMPFARHTMDRLWVRPGGGTSQGKRLLDHLAKQLEASGRPQDAEALVVPGTELPKIKIVAEGASPTDLGAAVRLDGRASAFAKSYRWQLDHCQSSRSLMPLCRSQTPSQDTTQVNCTVASEPVLGSRSALAAFTARDTGFYRVTLSVGDSSTPASQFLMVPDWKPCVEPTAVTDLGSSTVGKPVSPGVSSMFSIGNGEMSKHLLFVTAPSSVSVSPATCAGTTGCPAGTALTLTPLAVGQNNIQLKLRDQDGDEAIAGVHLAGTSSLTAANVTDVSTDANEALEVDLRAKNDDLADVTFELLAQTCPDGAIRTACLYNPGNTNPAANRASVVPSADGFTYTPPANFSTHARNGTAQFDGAAGRFMERIWYRMRRASNPNDFADGWVQVPVKAKTTFAETRKVYTLEPCSDCHTEGPGPLYPTFDYDTWRYGNDGKLFNLDHPRVDLTDPENSGFICYPRRDEARGCVTDDMRHDIDAENADYYLDAPARIESLLEWIRSGANNF